MTVRKRRKKNRMRGHRTHGKGDTKNNRGGGCRGGRGKAGSKKHKRFSYNSCFGTKKKLKTKEIKLRQPVFKTVNLADLMLLLERLIAEKKAVQENGFTVIDGDKIGFDKLLSRGEVGKKLLVRHLALSKKAAEKIEAAGGKVEFEEAAEEKPAEKPAKKKPAERPAEEKPVEKEAIEEAKAEVKPKAEEAKEEKPAEEQSLPEETKKTMPPGLEDIEEIGEGK